MNGRNYGCVALSGLFWMTLVMVAGCGSSTSGPPRFRVTGQVTYAGSPVPVGEILFVPVSGPGAMVEILDGVFATGYDGGVPSGEYKVTISGRTAGDGTALSDSRLLFKDYETTVTVSASDNVLNFDVPEPKKK
jgi:hypothetical protein